MVLAVDTQFSFSVEEINSVGLKSGFLSFLAELTLSSNFCEMVDLIVLAAGISIASVAALLASILLDLVVVEEADELVDEEEELDEVEDEEYVLLSESESLSVVVCPGMLPVVESVSV